MLVVFWLLILRPQQRRQREHLAVVAELAVGQHVMTVGGIIGTVTAVDDETVRVEASPGVELTLGRTFVRQRVVDDEVAAAAEQTEAGAAGPEVEDHVTQPDHGAPGAPTHGGPA